MTRLRATAPLLLAGVAAVASLARCGHAATVRFRPERAGGPGDPAQTEAEGVRLTARAGGWQGWPDDLEERITPIWIRLENRGPRVLRVGYENLQLQTDAGLRYIALPPEAVTYLLGFPARSPQPAVISPGPPGMLGPPPGMAPRPAGGPAPPTGALALDTALSPGGALEGTVFFRAPAVRVRRMALTAELVEDQTAERLGKLELSFARAVEPAAPAGAATSPPAGAAPPPGR